MLRFRFNQLTYGFEPLNQNWFKLFNTQLIVDQTIKNYIAFNASWPAISNFGYILFCNYFWCFLTFLLFFFYKYKNEPMLGKCPKQNALVHRFWGHSDLSGCQSIGNLHSAGPIEKVSLLRLGIWWWPSGGNDPWTMANPPIPPKPTLKRPPTVPKCRILVMVHRVVAFVWGWKFN